MANFELKKENEYKKYRREFKLYNFVFSPIFIVVIILLFQLVLIFNFKSAIDKSGLDMFLQLFNIAFIVYLINSRKVKNEYKITWMVIFTLMPGLGVLLYGLFRVIDIFNVGKSRLKYILNVSNKSYKNYCNDHIRSFADDEYKRYKYSNQNIINENLINEFSFFNFFDKYANLKTYTNTDITYINNGKEAFENILNSLSNAKKFIFIEIFILSDGIVWREILDILKKKAKDGVEVKLMFDGLNSVSSFGRKYCDELKQYGISAKVFKPLSPILSVTQNQRDHRKLFIIDNEIAYTGGINIADEYANLYNRFGVWKDAAVKIIGNAVESFTIMFLQVWYMDVKNYNYEFDKYLPKYNKAIKTASKTALVTPYSDYPGISENISFQIFKYLLNSAHKYIYIMTPYLVIDECMADTLEAAAKRGIDVRIIVPHIPDKKYVFLVNRSYYKRLTLSGVKVYEYLPGFVHAKCYIQDDIRAVVGTANLDYRSMFLHYENGVYYFADDDAISDLKKDFDDTFNECLLMDFVEIDKISVISRILGTILRIFAPLM